MKYNISTIKRKSVWGAMIVSLFTLHSSLFTLTSCNDAWDDHYPTEQTVGTESLLEIIKQKPELANFVKVAQKTHLYNNMHSTPVTYADLLASDQALTVWAPVIDDHTADSLLAVCQTQQGDSVVGLHFMANHIAHNLYNINASTDTTVRMFNEKKVSISPNTFGEANVTLKNLPASNGLMHMVDKSVDFSYNVYEALTSIDKYSHIGNYFSRYERQELDEDRSVVASIEDGKKIYSDSVMVLRNDLFREFEYFNVEDSSYTMLMPTAEAWNAAYDEAKTYFNYEGVEKGDSIQDYWAYRTLIADFLFNQSQQRADSVFFTSYKRGREYPYHTYRNAYSEGGPLWEGNIAKKVKCSNGAIYELAEWPYTKEQLYFHPITVQAENYSYNIADFNLCTYNARNVVADSVSGNAFLDITPNSSSSNWSVKFKVRNTLSGKYDVCAVILPKTVANVFSHDFKPNKFRAEVSYRDVTGKMHTEPINTNMSNNPYVVDTVQITTVDLPVCNYGQVDPFVTVTIKCYMTSKEGSTYSRNMYLDCIYLRPHKEDPQTEAEETASANIRKEGNK